MVLTCLAAQDKGGGGAQEAEGGDQQGQQDAEVGVEGSGQLTSTYELWGWQLCTNTQLVTNHPGHGGRR